MIETRPPLPRGVDFEAPETVLRVRRRYASERRFKAMGLCAVVFAASFVVILLGDILRKGMPAFSEHRVVLPVAFDVGKLDPKGTRDMAELRAGDYAALVRESLRAQFPEVSERKERRLLDALVSTGAPDDLRAAVLANPALVGQTISMPLLLSDDADLFLKGESARNSRLMGMGSLELAVQGKTATLTAAQDVFGASLAMIKAGLAKTATELEAELARFPALAGTNALLDAKRAEPSSRIADVRAREGDAARAETLDATQPSLLLVLRGGIIKITELAPRTATGQVLLPLDPRNTRPDWEMVRYLVPESNRRVSDAEIAWLEGLRARGFIEKGFASRFFSNGDSREPELAGIRGALIGSVLTLLVTLLLCLPIGVGAAVYLEEFAPKNRFTDLLEVNINNLAAVPSIVFGLLGLAAFLNFFNLPRSAPLVGGLVLALLVLPTIIIASRAALKAVPPSIKEAALGVGASHQQAVFQHVLPLAMPGIMTGTIIGMAHALGETAPLLMIGMVAFIVEVPHAITDAATVLPVQIYLWSDLPELAFQAKTAATIMVLLGVLFLMNGLAIVLRRQFERRW